MPDILYPPSRPQSVGEVLDSTFRIFRATVLKSLPYAVLALIAGQIPNVYYLVTGGMQAMMAQAYSPLWWVLYCAGLVLSLMLWSVILLGQHAAATGDAVAGAAAFSTVLGRLPALVLLWVLIMAAVGLCLLPARAFRPPAEYAVAVVLLIPAAYVMVALSCAWAAFLLAGKGPLASLAYSWRLASGGFWRLSLIYSVAVVLLIVLYALSGVVAAALVLPFAHGDVAVITAVSTVVVVILGAIGTPFYSALALSVFGDLSVRKEGIDLAQRLSVPAS